MKALASIVAFPIDCVRLITETFLRPQVFFARLAQLNPPLAADFNITQIDRHHLRDPGFWRLLAKGFAIPFAMIVLSFALGLHWLDIPEPRATFILLRLAAKIATITFLVALTMRVSIAIPCLVTFGIANGLNLLGTLSRVDFTASNLALAWIEAVHGAPILRMMGPFVCGLGIGVAGNPFPGARKRGLGTDLGAAVLGGIAATASVAVLIFVPRLYHTFKTHGLATDCVVAGVLTALLLGFSSYLQTRKARVAIWIGLGVVAFHALATQVMQLPAATLSPFLVAGRMVVGAVALYSLDAAYVLFAYAVALRLGGGRAALIAALLTVVAESVVTTWRWYDTMMLPPSQRVIACLPIVAGVLLGASQAAWRPILFYPLSMAWNLLLWRVDRDRTQGPFRLAWHTAFWDKGQWLPLTGLDEHLLLVWERAPGEAMTLERVLASGQQRWAALAARVELEARRFEACGSLVKVARVHAAEPLPGNDDPKTRPLRDLVRLSHDLDAAVARSQGSPYQYRAELTALSLRLSRHEEDWTVADHAFVRRMARVAAHWRRLVDEQLDAPSGPHETELQSPYIIGMPLPARQDLFVGRHEIAAQIERLVGDPLQPPILLYGQRRMGKTSLLHNLGQRLPSHVLPIFVDLMGPVSSSTDHAGFLCALARAIRRSAMNQADLALDPLPITQLSDNPFLHFDTWLDHFDRVLEAHGFQLALLALDEFETLAPRHGSLDSTPILHLFRHILQHRRRFRLLFAGSHTGCEIEALSGFLINAQVLHLGRLTDHEARRLVEHPVPDFGLEYDVEAVDHVVALTGRHPFLLQLLCRDVVAVKNHQPLPRRRRVTKPDVEEAVPPALQHGRLFFDDLAINQVPEPVKQGLIHLARLGADAATSMGALDRDLIDLGLRREIIEQVDTRWRFTIELVRLWFATAFPPSGAIIRPTHRERVVDYKN